LSFLGTQHFCHTDKTLAAEEFIIDQNSKILCFTIVPHFRYRLILAQQHYGLSTEKM